MIRTFIVYTFAPRPKCGDHFTTTAAKAAKTLVPCAFEGTHRTVEPIGQPRSPRQDCIEFFTIAALWFKPHRENRQLKAFVDGATAAATGAITGAVIILGMRSITGLATAAIALISFVALWRFKISEPILVVAAGVVGLILWPLLHQT